MKKERSSEDYIKELKDWQDHQYIPGYFTGGRIPVWLKYPGKPKLLGGAYLFLGLLMVAGLVYNFFTTPLSNIITDWPSAILGAIFMILYILVGIKLLKKQNHD